MQCNLLHCTGNHILSDAGAPVRISVTWACLKDPLLFKWLQETVNPPMLKNTQLIT